MAGERKVGPDFPGDPAGSLPAGFPAAAPFGDPRAAAAVRAAMLAHDRRLRRYMAQLLGVNDTDDAVQELYTRLLHVARGGTHEAFSLTYLKRAAESVAFDILRRRKSRRANFHVELDPEIAAALPDPFDVTKGRQRLAHLKEAVLSLPSLQRRILLMHRIDEMSLADVASELRLPLRTVQRHMMQALAGCRLHLQRRGWSEQE